MNLAASAGRRGFGDAPSLLVARIDLEESELSITFMSLPPLDRDRLALALVVGAPERWGPFIGW
jgi:hypothetical protein